MSPVPRWFHGVAYLLVALLAISAALQYNDPDPVRWIALYGAAAVLSAALPARRSTWGAALALGAVALAWSGYLVALTWGQLELADLTRDMSERGGAVEEGREAGGLAIAGGWLVVGGLLRRRWR